MQWSVASGQWLVARGYLINGFCVRAQLYPPLGKKKGTCEGLYQGMTSQAAKKIFDRVELAFRPASKSFIYVHSEESALGLFFPQPLQSCRKALK